MKRPFFQTFFITFPPPGFPPTANCSSLFRKDLFLSSKLQLSVRFFPYSVFNEQSLRYLLFNKYLVGLSGLEPPTSRLSGGCSNQLSYKPVDLPAVSDSGGDDGIRTHDPLLAGQVLSQLSYTPVRGGGLGRSISNAESSFSSRRRTSYSERTRTGIKKRLNQDGKNPKDFILFLLSGKEPSFNFSFLTFRAFCSASRADALLANGFRYRPLDLAPKVYFVLREDEIKGRKST